MTASLGVEQRETVALALAAVFMMAWGSGYLALNQSVLKSISASSRAFSGAQQRAVQLEQVAAEIEERATAIKGDVATRSAHRNALRQELTELEVRLRSGAAAEVSALEAKVAEVARETQRVESTLVARYPTREEKGVRAQFRSLLELHRDPDKALQRSRALIEREKPGVLVVPILRIRVVARVGDSYEVLTPGQPQNGVSVVLSDNSQNARARLQTLRRKLASAASLPPHKVEFFLPSAGHKIPRDLPTVQEYVDHIVELTKAQATAPPVSEARP